jgi:hypothetical protein
MASLHENVSTIFALVKARQLAEAVAQNPVLH